MNEKIFIINPGSTSTKLSLFEGEKELFTTDVFHDSSELLKFETINDQLEYRMQVIDEFLKEKGIDLSDAAAIVGRGGSCKPIEGGIYEINEAMVEDTRNCVSGLYHSSMLGVQMAAALKERLGTKPLLLMMDPPIMDELCDLARVTGIKGISRRAASHALNLKATARRHAAKYGQRYEDLNLIVCHIDGGISVTAHDHGRMVDGNDASGGEGPFTPTRMGTMAVTDVLRYLWDKEADEVRKFCSQAGGLSSHFGTSNSDKIHAMVDSGDEEAILVWNAMVYQVCKAIGSMAPVLKGHVDAIVLAGGLLRFEDLVKQIRERCEWIAPVYCYPGEFEQLAMAEGAVRVLRGEEQMKEYK